MSVMAAFVILSVGLAKSAWAQVFDYEVCDHWERFGTSCYIVVFQPASRSVADANCRNLQAFLVEVDSEREQKFIFNKLMSKLEPKTGVWIGLINTSQLGWTWNADRPLSDYRGWGYLEPNDFMNRGETCAEMRYWDGRWNDLVCETRTPYICEKEINVIKPITMASDIHKIDWSLTGHVIQATNVSAVLDCYQQCQSIPECLSFNYGFLTDSSLKSCELNKSTRGLVSKNYVKRKGFSYYD